MILPLPTKLWFLRLSNKKRFTLERQGTIKVLSNLHNHKRPEKTTLFTNHNLSWLMELKSVYRQLTNSSSHSRAPTRMHRLSHLIMHLLVIYQDITKTTPEIGKKTEICIKLIYSKQTLVKYTKPLELKTIKLKMKEMKMPIHMRTWKLIIHHIMWELQKLKSIEPRIGWPLQSLNDMIHSKISIMKFFLKEMSVSMILQNHNLGSKFSPVRKINKLTVPQKMLRIKHNCKLENNRIELQTDLQWVL